jgi:hypothetical protein
MDKPGTIVPLSETRITPLSPVVPASAGKSTLGSEKKASGVDLLAAPTGPDAPSETTGGMGKSPSLAFASEPRKNPWPSAHDLHSPPKAYETTGTVTFDDGLPSEPSGPLTGPVTPLKLKQKVEAVCGKQAREVHVVIQPDKSLRLLVKPASAAVKNELTEKILKIPEVASPDVHFEMDIAP